MLQELLRHASWFSFPLHGVQIRTRATSGRTRFIGQGNEEFAFVREGNALASRCVLFIQLVSAIGGIWLLEQPGQSILLSFSRINALWRTVTGYQKRFWMGKFGGPTPKPHMVLSNHLAFAQGIATGIRMIGGTGRG